MTRALAVALVALLAIAWPAISTEAAGPDSYTIQDGDTLVAIGAKLGVPSDQLYDWVNNTVSLNGLGDADSLTLGQAIKLPAGTTSSSSSASSTATVSQTTTSSSSGTTAAAKSSASGPGGSYTVQAGDTLLGIAAKQGISNDQMLTWVSSVQAMNDMSATDSLMPGQSLALPGSPSGSSSSSSSSAGASSSTASTATMSSSSTTSSTSTTPSSSGATAQTPITSTSAATATIGVVPTTSATALSSAGISSGFNGSATSYGDAYNGKNMGCIGAGPYNPNDPSIAAVGPSLYDAVPCGTPIEVCGPKGCIVAIRKDACPGCAGYHVDLSNAGLKAVCGPTSCSVRVRKIS